MFYYNGMLLLENLSFELFSEKSQQWTFTKNIIIQVAYQLAVFQLGWEKGRVQKKLGTI